jgi:hypothetical protein
MIMNQEEIFLGKKDLLQELSLSGFKERIHCLVEITFPYTQNK